MGLSGHYKVRVHTWINRLLEPWGWELAKRVPTSDMVRDIRRLMDPAMAAVIVDGGAFLGAFSRQLFPYYPDCRFHLFEPIPGTYERLRAALADCSNTYCHQAALQRRSMPVFMNVSRDPQCSSVCQPSPVGCSTYPQSTPVESIQVPGVSLDDWWAEIGTPEIGLLKLDLQGQELECLEGAGRMLAQTVRLLVIEVNFVPLYANIPLFPEVMVYLERHGFQLFQLYHLHSGPDTRLLWADALFLRAASTQGDSPGTGGTDWLA
jgi:FkbM family methyltransferase